MRSSTCEPVFRRFRVEDADDEGGKGAHGPRGHRSVPTPQCPHRRIPRSQISDLSMTRKNCPLLQVTYTNTVRSISIGPLPTQIDISDVQHLTAEFIVKYCGISRVIGILQK